MAINASGNGKAVATIYGGRFNTKILFIDTEHQQNNTITNFNIRNEDINDYNNDNLDLDPSQCKYCRKFFSRPSNRRQHEVWACKYRDLDKYVDIYARMSGRLPRSLPIENYMFDGNKSFVLPDGDGGTLQLLPSFTTIGEKGSTYYLAAPSGSGKTTWVSLMCVEILKYHPDYKVVLFSRYDDDTSYDPIVKSHMIKIKIDEELLTNPIDIEKELKTGCIVIFDDITSSTISSALQKYMKRLKDELLENYRSHTDDGKDCFVFVTNHLVCDNLNTKLSIYESDYIVLFPDSSRGQNTRCLKTYIGMTNKEADFALKLNSRWICIHNRYPKFVVYDKGLYLF